MTEFIQKVNKSCQEALCNASPLKPILVVAISARRTALQSIIHDLTEGKVSPTRVDLLLSEEAEKVSQHLIKAGSLSKREAIATSERAVFTLARHLL